MRPRIVKVDDDGLHLERGFLGSLHVHFDGWRAWSGTVERRDQELVRWPKRLARKLDGVSLVTVEADEGEVFSGEVTFGSGEGRVEMVDRNGVPIMIDKWGLIQRPFVGRRESGGVEAMTSMAERVLQVMRDSCGLEGWISFGTLLGAARSGEVIGHDSDIDLCYLSEKTTPAEMAIELWDVARALVDAGIEIKHKTGSFITIVYDAPDGGRDGIDIYTCFYVDDFLHETATIREVVPRSAILPLTTLEFEGRQMPAPADPDTMLAISYGPNWKVPDPSFRHQPGPEVVDRFDSWFGLLMPQSREWGAYNLAAVRQSPPPSDFAHWVTTQMADDAVGDAVGARPRAAQVHVLDVGCGAGADLKHYVHQGHLATGFDYAPGSAATSAPEWPEGVRKRGLNLFSMRDAYAQGATAARLKGPRVVTARELFEALHPQARDGFWQFTSLALAAGGRAYLEGVSRSPRQCKEWTQETQAGRVWPVSPVALAEAAAAHGGTVVVREGFPAADRAVRGGPETRWRMIVEWPAPKENEDR